MKELVILGTAAQVPTRDRNHNGYFLRWEDEGILFDPGENTQRQMTFANVASTSITKIAITHMHGDHCLGLPGVLMRISLDKSSRPVGIYYPADAQVFYDSTVRPWKFERDLNLHPHPLDTEGIVARHDNMVISCAPLDHRTPCMGYRIDEPEARSVCIDALKTFGLTPGPAIGKLKRDGRLQLDDGRTICLDDVSVLRPGQSFAFIMDTRPCENAIKLARHVDILLCEATFLENEAHQAHEYYHMTARQAAILAREAGAKKLILSHFSQRYLTLTEHLAQAREVYPNTYVARDLDHFDFPKRIRSV